MAVDPRNFLFNTDYPMDQIVYFEEGKIEANTPSTVIETGLDFPILPFGVWSYNQDFSQNYSFSVDAVLFAAKGTSYGDKHCVVIWGSANQPYYYRVYGLMPSTVNKNAPATAKNSKDFIFNTDYNYRKLFASGVFSYNDKWTPTGPPVIQPFIVKHNLGYKPQVSSWSETRYSYQPEGDYSISKSDFFSMAHTYYDDATSTQVMIPKSGVEVTDTEIIFYPQIEPLRDLSGADKKIHYRIYYDEAK